jgi:hypothetical protein
MATRARFAAASQFRWRCACESRIHHGAVAIASQSCTARVLLAIAIGCTLSATPTRADRPLPWHPVPPDAYRPAFPIDAEAERGRLAVLGEDYLVHHTDHWSFAHHRDSMSPYYRAAILEDLYAAFTLFFDTLGVPLERPVARLAVVFTPTRERFVAFAGGDVPDNVAGLYVGEIKTALFYDVMGRNEDRGVLTAGLEIEGDLARMEREIAAADKGAQFTIRFHNGPTRTFSKAAALELVRNALRGQRSARHRFRYDRGQGSLETMTHEGAHQLCFEMGVFQGDVPLPRWIVEGMATLFEPSEHGFLLETGRTHWRRWAVLRDEHRAGRRLQLLDLLTNDERFGDFQLAVPAYHEAWSLVQFLVSVHPEGFAPYLAALREPEASATARRRIELFEASFGASLPELEPRWRQHVDTLGLPDD